MGSIIIRAADSGDDSKAWVEFSAPNAHRKHRKLRMSCDACANSKVRCGKEHPACHRCQVQQIQCHYSIARRVAKPTTSASTSATSLRRANSRKQHCASPSQIEAQGRNGMLSPTPSSRPSVGPIVSDYEELAMCVPFGGPEMSSNIFDLPECHTSSPYRASNNDFQQFEIAIQDQRRVLPSIFDPTDDHFFCHDRGSSSTLPDLEHVFPSQIEYPNPYHHQDCNSLAVSTLLRLHVPTLSCSSLTTADVPPPRNIDSVLDMNTKAINQLNSILNCQCSLDPSYAFMITQVLSKLFLWYESIASKGVNSVTTRFKDLPGAAEAVTFLPITIGAYEISGEEQNRLIEQLVLGDLAKVEQVIESFSKRYCADYGREGGSADRMEICMALEAYLKSRLKAAKGKLSIDT